MSSKKVNVGYSDSYYVMLDHDYYNVSRQYRRNRNQSEILHECNHTYSLNQQYFNVNISRSNIINVHMPDTPLNNLVESIQHIPDVDLNNEASSTNRSCPCKRKQSYVNHLMMKPELVCVVCKRILFKNQVLFSKDAFEKFDVSEG